MEEYIYFVTRGNHPDVVRYVSGVKKILWIFTKVRFTVDVRKAVKMSGMKKIDAFEEIKKRYGEDAVIETTEELTPIDSDPRLFYLVVSEDKKEEMYFSSIGKDGKLAFSRNVRDAYISQSQRDIEETLVNVRIHGGKKVKRVAIAMNIDNSLQDENFVIVCKSRYSGMILFLKERNMDGLITLHPKSDKARKLGYDDAIAWYEWLKEKHKENSYAVIVAPNENIKGSQLKRYLIEHGNDRSVAVSIKLPN